MTSLSTRSFNSIIRTQARARVGFGFGFGSGLRVGVRVGFGYRSAQLSPPKLLAAPGVC